VLLASLADEEQASKPGRLNDEERDELRAMLREARADERRKGLR